MGHTFSILLLSIGTILLSLVQIRQAGEIRRLRETVKTLTEDALGRVLRGFDAARDAWDPEEAH